MGSRKRLLWIGRHLMIKSKFLNDILKGTKRATIRLGKVQVKSREFYIHSGGQIIAKARLKRITYKRISELTDDDAKIDGFSSRDELINALKEHYGDIKDDDYVTIIEFDIIEFLNKTEEKTYYGLNAYEIAKLALKYLNLPEEERKILEALVKTRSIRYVAKKFFGKLSKRWKVRRLISRVAKELYELGIIKPNYRQ